MQAIRQLEQQPADHDQQRAALAAVGDRPGHGLAGLTHAEGGEDDGKPKKDNLIKRKADTEDKRRALVLRARRLIPHRPSAPIPAAVNYVAQTHSNANLRM